MFDIKRSFETYLARRLSSAINGLKFYASKGSTEEDAQATAGTIEPPFGIISVNEAEEIATGSNVYALDGVVCIITHLQESGPGEHSQWVKQVKNELDNLNSECHPTSLTPPGFDLTIHGIDVAFSKYSQSQEDLAQADTLAFTAGATSNDELTPNS